MSFLKWEEPFLNFILRTFQISYFCACGKKSKKQMLWGILAALGARIPILPLNILDIYFLLKSKSDDWYHSLSRVFVK